MTVADKRCENGHFIDETWDICPYCPQEASDPAIPVIRPRAGEGTGWAGGEGSRPSLSPRITAASPSPLAAAVQPAPMERTVTLGKAAMESVTPQRFVVGWLVGLSGAARGESYPVRMGRNVIGRDRRSDIVINDDQASSHHADLVFRPDERRFILMDHNSTNGTYVNEAEIEPRRDLSGNEVVRIGSHRFVFVPLCHDGFFWGDEGLLK